MDWTLFPWDRWVVRQWTKCAGQMVCKSGDASRKQMLEFPTRTQQMNGWHCWDCLVAVSQKTLVEFVFCYLLVVTVTGNLRFVTATVNLRFVTATVIVHNVHSLFASCLGVMISGQVPTASTCCTSSHVLCARMCHSDDLINSRLPTFYPAVSVSTVINCSKNFSSNSNCTVLHPLVCLNRVCVSSLWLGHRSISVLWGIMPHSNLSIISCAPLLWHFLLNLVAVWPTPPACFALWR